MPDKTLEGGKELPPNQNEKGKDTTPSTAEEYAAALEKVKKNTVSREEYEKLRAEHSTLIEKTANGELISEPEPEADTRDYKQIAADFLKNNEGATNLDRATELLKYRDKMLKAGKYDPFTPNSKFKATTQSERETSERVADVLRECVEKCGGDPEVFNQLLERHSVRGK